MTVTPKPIYFAALLSAALLACGGCGSTAASVATATSSTNPYVTAYQAAKWQSNTTVSFPSACSMTYVTTGVPAVHSSYYLAPTGAGQTTVATTPVSHLALALIAYPASSLKGDTATLNICPTAASSTTTAGMGAIGFMISGIAIFNSYEATGTVAMADNVSYNFTDPSGNAQTASFIDTCASHAAAGMGSSGSTWHYHAVPSCVTSLVDTSTGPLPPDRVCDRRLSHLWWPRHQRECHHAQPARRLQRHHVDYAGVCDGDVSLRAADRGHDVAIVDQLLPRDGKRDRCGCGEAAGLHYARYDGCRPHCARAEPQTGGALVRYPHKARGGWSCSGRNYLHFAWALEVRRSGVSGVQQNPGNCV